MCRAATFLLAGCTRDEFDYLRTVEEAVDIHEIVECAFDPTSEGWERYDCLPVFSARDVDTASWERGAIGEFDIIARDVFGAPFYQLWYSGSAGTGADIGYAVSMDGVSWRRHALNPVLRRDQARLAAFDRDDATVGCVAFDGVLGVYHLWYTGTNDDASGTTFGHATSRDGVAWSKDNRNPLDPFAEVDDPAALSRVWGCDALWEDGSFHMWVGGVTRPAGIVDNETWLEQTHYEIGYLSTRDGSTFEVSSASVLSYAEHGGDQFDAEGVHRPSVVAWPDGVGDDRWFMLYAGYEDVIATQSPGSGLVYITTDGRGLGIAAAPRPDGGWHKLRDSAVPLDASGARRIDAPRALFIHGRLHVFYVDQFEDPGIGDEFSGIGLGIAPFPDLLEAE